LHDYQDLITIFNQCFSFQYNTRLVKGGDEPIYLPARETCSYNSIYFAHGYFSSALHECAHWFIAGEERRKLVDFGYWYNPDGRNKEQQALFQKAEVKPQAIEWILSKAAGYRFRVSVDNLNGVESDTEVFKHSVHSQVALYCTAGLPSRAEQFRSALCSFYKTPLELKNTDFSLCVL
jgi:elongation factor P hydroxylase